MDVCRPILLCCGGTPPKTPFNIEICWISGNLSQAFPSCTQVAGLTLSLRFLYTCISRTSDAWFLISSQTNYHPEYHRELKNISQHHSNVLLLGLCSDPKLTNEEKIRKRCIGPPGDRDKNIYKYPDILQVK